MDDNPAEILNEFYERSLRDRVVGTGIPEPFEIHTEIQKLEGDESSITRLEEETRPPVQPTLAPPPPVVESVDPAVGDVEGGAVVDIHGTGFLDLPTLKVYFGDNLGTDLTFVDSTKLTVTVPAGSAGFADVTVEHVPGIEDTLLESFHYVAAPIIDHIDPPYGDVAGGYVVSIHGSGFLDIPTLQVFIGGNTVPSLTYVDSTLITVIAPAGSEGETVLSVEHVSGGTLANVEFRYQTAPTHFVWISDGPLAHPPHNHPWGWFIGQSMYIQVHAYKGGALHSTYQGKLLIVEVAGPNWGAGLSWNASWPDGYPFHIVNGVAQFHLVVVNSTGGAGNSLSGDLGARDAVYTSVQSNQGVGAVNTFDPH